MVFLRRRRSGAAGVSQSWSERDTASTSGMHFAQTRPRHAAQLEHDRRSSVSGLAASGALKATQSIRARQAVRRTGRLWRFVPLPATSAVIEPTAHVVERAISRYNPRGKRPVALPIELALDANPSSAHRVVAGESKAKRRAVGTWMRTCPPVGDWLVRHRALPRTAAVFIEPRIEQRDDASWLRPIKHDVDAPWRNYVPPHDLSPVALEHDEMTDRERQVVRAGGCRCGGCA